MSEQGEEEAVDEEIGTWVVEKATVQQQMHHSFSRQFRRKIVDETAPLSVCVG